MTEEKIALRSLLTFLCVAHQGFALLSLFSSLPNENLLSTKLVFLSQSPTIALAWQMDLFSPASSFSPCPFLSRHALPHTELELECHSRLLTDSTTHPYSCSRAVMAESLTNYSCKLFIRDEVKWVIQSCLTLHDFMDCSPWDSPGQNTGMGSLPLCQGIFPTQGSNPGLPHCRWILYQLNHKGSPGILAWVAYPFSRGSSRPRNRTRVSCIAGGFFTNWAIREAQGWIGHETNLQVEPQVQSLDGEWKIRAGTLIQLKEVHFLIRRTLSTFAQREAGLHWLGKKGRSKEQSKGGLNAIQGARERRKN